MGYVYILLTVAFTVYGQLVLKWQIGLAGPPPEAAWPKFVFLAGMFLNPWVVSGLFAAVLASLAWMATLTKFPLSFAYPFMSLSFIGVMFASAALFSEALTVPKVAGMALVVLGLAVGAQKW